MNYLGNHKAGWDRMPSHCSGRGQTEDTRLGRAGEELHHNFYIYVNEIKLKHTCHSSKTKAAMVPYY